MNLDELLLQSRHRPWPIPDKNWKYYQERNRVIFLRWEVDINEVSELVPDDLEIDLFNGKAWISLVAFSMENIRMRNLPAFSPISNFHEINIRTYVKSGSKTGVYFLSIEGAKRFSCFIAKRNSLLPYRHSKIIRTQNSYDAFNSEYQVRLVINYTVMKKLDKKSELDYWLTERYALFQVLRDKLYEYEIHHLEWVIKDIRINKLDVSYPRLNHVICNKPEKVQYSDGVTVIAWSRNNNAV